MIIRYDYSDTPVEQLIILNWICSMSNYPMDKEMKIYIMEELNKRLKENPNLEIDLSQFMEKKDEKD